MDFKEFIENIVIALPEYLLQYDIEDIHIEEVYKNNGVKCTGLAICIKDENISPNIYLEYFYSLYKQGSSIEEILELIRDEYNEARIRMLNDEYIEMTKEDLADNVFIKLVNYERNEAVLRECPHMRFLDLAITFRYLVKQDEEGIASALINNIEMDRWDISLEELYQYAYDNTRRLFSPMIKPISQVLNELTDGLDIPDDNNLYVLSNEHGINGATCIIYQDLLHQLAVDRGTNIYILPSSIHEVLLLPEGDNTDSCQLVEMVKEINEFVVRDIDFLSDTVYIYDLNDQCIKF